MKPKAISLLLALLTMAGSDALLAQNEGDDAPPIADPDMPRDSLVVETDDSVTVIEEESGDVLRMPEERVEPGPRRVLPQHGMKMNEVEREYGTPRDRHLAVGQPPIIRWDYDGFSVFFERSTVLHAVQADRPAEIVNKDELLPP